MIIWHIKYNSHVTKYMYTASEDMTHLSSKYISIESKLIKKFKPTKV